MAWLLFVTKPQFKSMMISHQSHLTQQTAMLKYQNYSISMVEMALKIYRL